MISQWKPLTAGLLLTFFTIGYLQAQEPVKEKKDEQIIIRKKGQSNEKLTIVVDGDKVTINGKPVEEFKNDSIEIRTLKGLSARVRRFQDRGPDASMPPMHPGGAQFFSQDFATHLKGRSNGAFLGVVTEKADNGAIIKDVSKESPAEKAGLQKGDIITRIDTSAITDGEDLYTTMGRYKPEDKVAVTYLRNGKELTANATLRKNKHVYSFQFDDKFEKMAPREFREFRFNDDMRSLAGWHQQPRLGLQIQDTEDGKGVKVTESKPDAPAAKAGLQKDDIITGINGKDIHSVDDIREHIQGMKEGDTVKIEFKRNSKRQTAEVKFPKKLKTSSL